jgi:lipopolysaccharide transport system permease protein
MGWSLLQPLAMTAILCWVVQRFFQEPLQSAAPRVLSALACWNFIVVATTSGCQSLFHGECYIRQHPAPVAIYPLRTVLGAMFHLVLALGVVIALSWWLLGFSNLPALASLLPALGLLFLLGWSLAVLAAFANVYFQDTQHLCEVGFQMLFYATPIIYTEEMLGPGRLQELVHWNPLSAIIQLFREPIWHGQVPSLATYGMATVTVLALAGLAVLTTCRLQKAFIFRM